MAPAIGVACRLPQASHLAVLDSYLCHGLAGHGLARFGMVFATVWHTRVGKNSRLCHLQQLLKLCSGCPLLAVQKVC